MCAKKGPLGSLAEFMKIRGGHRMNTPITMVPGIGPHMALCLADKNISTTEGLVDTPLSVLEAVKGLGPVRAQQIQSAAKALLEVPSSKNNVSKPAVPSLHIVSDIQVANADGLAGDKGLEDKQKKDTLKKVAKGKDEKKAKKVKAVKKAKEAKELKKAKKAKAAKKATKKTEEAAKAKKAKEAKKAKASKKAKEAKKAKKEAKAKKAKKDGKAKKAKATKNKSEQKPKKILKAKMGKKSKNK